MQDWMLTVSFDTEPGAPGRLNGRRIVVTGGGDGIGAACSAQFAREGARVSILDIREDAARERASTLSDQGYPVYAFACDVGDESSVQRGFDRAAAAMGGIDGVVAAAGIAMRRSLVDTTAADWDLITRINLTGVFFTLREAVPYLVRNDASAIVTIGSVASLVGVSNPAYSATKGGVLMLTRSIAAELAPHGVRANCICPGGVETALFHNSASLHGVEPTPGHLSVVTTNPMKRMGRADEISSVAAFLLSDEASYMTAAAIPVDGGLSST